MLERRRIVVAGVLAVVVALVIGFVGWGEPVKSRARVSGAATASGGDRRPLMIDQRVGSEFYRVDPHTRVGAKALNDPGNGAVLLGGASASISGTVRGASDEALADAQVCAWLDAERAPTQAKLAPRCASTDRQGRYSIDGLAALEYEVSAGARGHVPTVLVSGPSEPLLRLRSGEHRRGIDFVLENGGVLAKGRVVDAMGGPIEGATVHLRQAQLGSRVGAAVETGPEGWFELWTWPGQIELHASAAGYAKGVGAGSAPGASTTIVLMPEAVLAGIVVDATSGQPVQGAYVLGEGSWGERSVGSLCRHGVAQHRRLGHLCDAASVRRSSRIQAVL